MTDEHLSERIKKPLVSGPHLRGPMENVRSTYPQENVMSTRKRMTPREADKIIKSGKPVTVHNTHWDETFTKTFVKRDRWLIYSEDGGVFERSELEVVVSK